jgi:4-hydroxybenzoate polyprenyltransferase
VALRLALAMTALQFAIGTVNDLADEPRDRGRKSGKPLPRGLLSRGTAGALATGLVVLGLALSAPSGAATVVVALAGLGVGLAYDVALKGTLWSWLPFAVGVPLLPVYAWLGAADRLPGSFAILVPVAVVAGAGLAITNLLADLERDAAAGVATVATRLGGGRAWLVAAALLTAVVVVAMVTALAARGGGWGLVGVAAGGVVIATGLALGRSASPARRERAWELAAVGVGLLAAGWVAAMAAAGAL